MRAVAFWLRVDLRRTWQAHIGLALLIGLLAGAALIVVEGAHRTATVFDRFTKASTNPDVIMDFRHAQRDTIDLTDLHFSVPGGHDLVFIGGATFAGYHQHHPGVLGMVRYAGGLVQVNVDTHLATVEFEILMHGAPALSAHDFQLI